MSKESSSSQSSSLDPGNSLAYRLLWPSPENGATTSGEHLHQSIDLLCFPSASDLSALPDKTTLIGRIKDLALQSSDPFLYHLLYWSGAHQELLNELNKQNFSSYNQIFFWMAMFNDSIDVQPLFDRVLNGMKETHDENVLEFVTMMIKAKRHNEVLDYLIHHDHTE